VSNARSIPLARQLRQHLGFMVGHEHDDPAFFCDRARGEEAKHIHMLRHSILFLQEVLEAQTGEEVRGKDPHTQLECACEWFLQFEEPAAQAELVAVVQSDPELQDMLPRFLAFLGKVIALHRHPEPSTEGEGPIR
jgi:hypothetical protein